MANNKLQINSKIQNSKHKIQNTKAEIIEREKIEIPKEKWICEKCGKSTWDTDYKHLVAHNLHLACALREESLKN